jgi:hypothetical protein
VAICTFASDGIRSDVSLLSTVALFKVTARWINLLNVKNYMTHSSEMNTVNHVIQGEISGSHGDENEDGCLLGCSTV